MFCQKKRVCLFRFGAIGSVFLKGKKKKGALRQKQEVNCMRCVCICTDLRRDHDSKLWCWSKTKKIPHRYDTDTDTDTFYYTRNVQFDVR